MEQRAARYIQVLAAEQTLRQGPCRGLTSAGTGGDDTGQRRLRVVRVPPDASSDDQRTDSLCLIARRATNHMAQCTMRMQNAHGLDCVCCGSTKSPIPTELEPRQRPARPPWLTGPRRLSPLSPISTMAVRHRGGNFSECLFRVTHSAGRFRPHHLAPLLGASTLGSIGLHIVLFGPPVRADSLWTVPRPVVCGICTAPSQSSPPPLPPLPHPNSLEE